MRHCSKGLKLVQNFQNKLFSHCRIAFDQAFTHSEETRNIQETPNYLAILTFINKNRIIYELYKTRINDNLIKNRINK